MKSFALNSLARLCVIAFQFVNIKIYTNYLDANQLGIFFFLLTISYSANAFLFVPIDYFQQSKLSKIMTDSSGAKSLLNFNWRVIVCYIIFSTIIAIGFAVLNFKYLTFAVQVTSLALALYVVQALRNTLNNLGHGKHVSISFIQEAAVKVTTLFIMVYFVKAEPELLINVWLFALFLTASYLALVAKRHKIFSGRSEVTISAAEVFRFSYPYSIGAVLSWIQTQGYRLVLVPLGYSELVGVFATLSSIGSAAIGAASLVYSQHFTPKIYRTNGAYTETYLKGAFAVTVFVVIATLIFGKYIVQYLTSPMFASHWELILFGVVTDAANLFLSALTIELSLSNNTNRIIDSSLLGFFSMACVFLMLSIAGFITVGTIGVPLLISQWLVVIYMFWKLIKSRILG